MNTENLKSCAAYFIWARYCHKLETELEGLKAIFFVIFKIIEATFFQEYSIH